MPKKKTSTKETNTENSDKTVKTETKKNKPLKKKSGITSWVIAGVLLICIVALFIYAQNSISKVEDDKKEIESQTRVLKSTVNNLQQEVSNLNQKAEDLEESTKKSDEYLFNEAIKKRKIPDSVDTKEWQVYKDDEWKMELHYPQTWQIAQSAGLEAEEAEADEQKVESRKEITLEPVKQSEFLRSMQIMPYKFDGQKNLDEKVKSFESKGIMDIQDFNGGKLVYFLEQSNSLIVPTIMILSDHGDYKAIFRVNNVLHGKYFQFLSEFESIVAVVKLETKAAEAAPEEPKPEEPKPEENPEG